MAALIVVGLPGFLVSLVAAYKATFGARRADDAAKATDLSNQLIIERTAPLNGGLAAAKEEIVELKAKVAKLEDVIAGRK